MLANAINSISIQTKVFYIFNIIYFTSIALIIVELVILSSSGSKQLDISSSKIESVSDYQNVKNNVILIIRNFNKGLNNLYIYMLYLYGYKGCFKA